MSKSKILHPRRIRGGSKHGVIDTPIGVASKLPQLREKYGISQEQMARIMGASWPTISRWERSVAKPSIDHVEKLQRLYQLLTRIDDAIPASEFFKFVTTPHPLLRGYPPLDLLNSGYSFEELLMFVDSAKSGDMT